MNRSKHSITRRQFVKKGAAAAAAFTAAPFVLSQTAAPGADDDLGTIPQAVLGKTGVKVATLGLGTACLGHQNQNKPNLADLVPIFSEAVDRGITYVDTARIYGGAEDALKEVLKTRRDKVFLVTKVWADTAEEARKSFEESLEKLGVDSVDILHLHSGGNRKVDVVLGKDGAWEQLLKYKKDGKTRFIGLTGHSVPANFVRIIEESGTCDAMMIAMNFVDRHIYGFEDKVLPVARKHKVGVMAMKVYGGIRGGFRNYSSKTPFPSQLEATHHDDAVRYCKSLEGVTGMVIGVHSAEQLRQNIKRFLASKPLSSEELKALLAKGETIAKGWTPRFGPVA